MEMFLHLVINPQVSKKLRMKTYICKETSLQKIHTTSSSESSQQMIRQLQLAVHLTPVTVKRVLQIPKRSQKLGLWLLNHQMNPIPTWIKKLTTSSRDTGDTDVEVIEDPKETPEEELGKINILV